MMVDFSACDECAPTRSKTRFSKRNFSAEGFSIRKSKFFVYMMCVFFSDSLGNQKSSGSWRVQSVGD